MDDASTDSSAEIINKLLLDIPDGLNVDYQRNFENVGLVSQMNKLVGAFKNKLIVVQAGDDESYPFRLEQTYKAWIANGKPSLVLANHDDIDEQGRVIKAFDNKKIKLKPYTLKRIISRRAMVYGCCAALSSDMLNYYGAINPNVINEDRVNVFRAYFRCGIKYLNIPLIRYRSTVGISAFHVNDLDSQYKKLVIEAKREIADLNCHLADLEKIENDKVKRELLKRKKAVLWCAELRGPLNFLDVLIALVRGNDIAVVLKVYSRLNKHKLAQ